MTAVTDLQAVTSRLRQAGIDEHRFNTESLEIREVENITLVRLRSSRGLDTQQLEDLDLPDLSGKCSGTDPVKMCLRPGEWVLMSENTPAEALLSKKPGLNATGQLHAWDESDGLALFRLEGPAAPWLMRKNSGLDFHITPGTPRHCAQCKFGQISLIVYFSRDKNAVGVFNLVVDRSLAEYLWKLLRSTAPHASELHSGV